MSSWLPDLSNIFGQKKQSDVPQVTSSPAPVATSSTPVPSGPSPPLTQGGRRRRRGGKTKKGGKRKRATRRR